MTSASPGCKTPSSLFSIAAYFGRKVYTPLNPGGRQPLSAQVIHTAQYRVRPFSSSQRYHQLG